jgi:hypothetical protein
VWGWRARQVNQKSMGLLIITPLPQLLIHGSIRQRLQIGDTLRSRSNDLLGPSSLWSSMSVIG